MASNGASFKAAAKRTAFGELTNTNRGQSDAGQAANKSYLVKSQASVTYGKENASQGAFRVPAQRVKSLAAPLGAHPNGSLERDGDQSAKPALPVIKQNAARKATVIYSDNNTRLAEYSRHSEVAAIEHVQQLPKNTKHKSPRHHKSQPQLRTDHPALRRSQSRSFSQNGGPSYADGGGQKRRSGTYQVDASEDIAASRTEAHEEHFDHGYQTSLATAPSQADMRAGASASVSATATASDANPRSAGLSEVDEYWEEDEDFYEDQGYVTAHSFRSTGDNTTGGVTAMIAPKITSKVQKDLDEARAWVEFNLALDEDDDDEFWDVSMVVEYGDEIFSYMRVLEIKMQPNPHYMEIQTEIQWSMRSVLMEWLIQVHSRFSLLPETLFLAVNYIDRFLTAKIVSVGKLQLVGATALFIAAKYEEINCPSIQEIVYMVDGGYSADEILKAERFMLSMLQFELGWPGPLSFLRRISKADDYDIESRTLAKYFLETTIVDERFVASPPSYLAAGAHCLARTMLRKGNWTPAHVYYSGYTWTQLRGLASMMIDCCRNPRVHHLAVYDKYYGSRYRNASHYVDLELHKGFSFPYHTPQMHRSITLANVMDDSSPLLLPVHDYGNVMIPIEG